MEMINLNNGSENLNSVKAIVYGVSGVGKTRLALSKAEDFRPFVIDFENGLLSISGENVLAAKCSAVGDVRKAVGFAVEEKCTCIILDSLSELAEIYLQELMGKYKDDRQAYVKMLDGVKSIFRYFSSLSLDVVYVCKSDGDGKIMLPSKRLSSEVMFFVDEVFYMTEEKGVKVFHTKTNDNILAKDRSGRLDSVELADIGCVFRKIKGL